MILMSVPASSECVAKQCRMTCGVTRLVSPASTAAHCSAFRATPVLNGVPRDVAKSQGAGGRANFQ